MWVSSGIGADGRPRGPWFCMGRQRLPPAFKGLAGRRIKLISAHTAHRQAHQRDGRASRRERSWAARCSEAGEAAWLLLDREELPRIGPTASAAPRLPPPRCRHAAAARQLRTSLPRPSCRHGPPWRSPTRAGTTWTRSSSRRAPSPSATCRVCTTALGHSWAVRQHALVLLCCGCIVTCDL